jgi:hypothetical protein
MWTYLLSVLIYAAIAIGIRIYVGEEDLVNWFIFLNFKYRTNRQHDRQRFESSHIHCINNTRHFIYRNDLCDKSNNNLLYNMVCEHASNCIHHIQNDSQYHRLKTFKWENLK